MKNLVIPFVFGMGNWHGAGYHGWAAMCPCALQNSMARGLWRGAFPTWELFGERTIAQRCLLRVDRRNCHDFTTKQTWLPQCQSRIVHRVKALSMGRIIERSNKKNVLMIYVFIYIYIYKHVTTWRSFCRATLFGKSQGRHVEWYILYTRVFDA